MKEFEVFVPTYFNDGSPVYPETLERIGERLLAHFGGVSYSPQPYRGFWRMGPVVFRDEVIIFRVLADDVRRARRFLRQLKEDLKRDLKQKQILILEKDVGTV